MAVAITNRPIHLQAYLAPRTQSVQLVHTRPRHLQRQSIVCVRAVLHQHIRIKIYVQIVQRAPTGKLAVQEKKVPHRLQLQIGCVLIVVQESTNQPTPLRAQHAPTIVFVLLESMPVSRAPFLPTDNAKIVKHQNINLPIHLLEHHAQHGQRV